MARQLSKDSMRRQVLGGLLSARERDTDQVVAYMLQDEVQRLIGAHFERLKSKEHTSWPLLSQVLHLGAFYRIVGGCL